MTSATPSTSDVTRYIIIAIALIAVALLIWYVSEVFIIAFGGIVVATVLRAVADPVSRVTGWSPRLSLVATLLGLAVAFGLLFWLFGRQAAQQFAEMREQLPSAVEKFEAWLARSRFGREAVDALGTAIGDASPLTSAGAAVSSVVGGLATLLLVIFVGIYLAADPKLYRDGALRLLPPTRRQQVGRAVDDAGTALHQWLIAQIFVMIAVGVMTGVGLALLGVPLSLSLGLLAGLLEFIPVVGPIVSAVPGALLAFTQGPDTALYALLVYVAVQQIESNILTPLVQRWAVELPPVIALLSIVACGLVFGVLGVVFATPMAVAVMAMVKHLYVEDTLENGNPPAAAKAAAARERLPPPRV